MSKFFDKVVDTIDKARNKAYNAIPAFFKRYAPFMPGIVKATYYCLTANSGVGKSILARQIFIYDAIEFIEQHPQLGIKYHCIFFSFEESKEAFIYKGISKQLWEKYNISLSTKQLKSLFNNTERGIKSKVTDDIMDKIKTFSPYFDLVEKYVDIIDDIRNPTGIYKYIKKYASEHGKFYWIEKDKDGIEVSRKEIKDVHKTNSDGVLTPDTKWNHYEPDDPDAYVVIMSDHVSLTQVERGTANKHEAMTLLSSEYMIRVRNQFGYSPVAIHQQAADKEKIETNFKGNTLEEKLEPSLDSLGDNKTLARDYDVIYSIFSPVRYKILSHNGYDISALGNSYRYINCLKDRDGEPNVGISCYFNGQTGTYQELDSIDPMWDKREAANFYKKYPEIKADS